VGHLSFLPPVTDLGIGVNQYRLPVKDVKFLKANPIDGNGYNSFYWRGSLAWELYPSKKVFVDGRVPAHPDEVITAATLLRSNPVFSWNIKEIFEVSGLVAVYGDQTGAQIYIRNNSSNTQYIAEFGYQIYTPDFNYDTYCQQQQNLEYLNQLIQEITRHYTWSGSE